MTDDPSKPTRIFDPALYEGHEVPPHFTLIAPRAAAWLFERSDTRLRQMALRGEVATAQVEGWGGKTSRFYAFDDLCDHFGPPSDRLRFLRQFSTTHVWGGERGGAVVTLIVQPPRVAGEEELVGVPQARRVLGADQGSRLFVMEEGNE